MDSDTNIDMVFSCDSSFAGADYKSLAVFSPSLNQIIIRNSSGVALNDNPTHCIPVDFNIDGSLDLVCSDKIKSWRITPNYVNALPTINTITFSPNTIVSVGTNLEAIISSTDAEGDTKVYAVRCDSGENISVFAGSNILSCVYTTLGNKEMTLFVSDTYHDYENGEYAYHTQSISVTSTGITCNNNGICESGESNINCPNDCITSNVTYSQSEGGILLPTKLVDTEGNTETGILPEIYFGTIAFFSQTLQPMIIVIFLIISVFIILAFGFVIKRVVEKIKQL
jgi:hypothetical protein